MRKGYHIQSINLIIFTYPSYYCLALAKYTHFCPTAAGCDTARAAGKWWDAPTEPDMTNYWTWHKKLLDVTHHRVRSQQIYRWCCERIHSWVRRSFLRAKFHRKLRVSTGDVLGSGIVRGKQYWVTVSAYPHTRLRSPWYGIRNTEIHIKHQQEFKMEQRWTGCIESY